MFSRYVTLPHTRSLLGKGIGKRLSEMSSSMSLRGKRGRSSTVRSFGRCADQHVTDMLSPLASSSAECSPEARPRQVCEAESLVGGSVPREPAPKLCLEGGSPRAILLDLEPFDQLKILDRCRSAPPTPRPRRTRRGSA